MSTKASPVLNQIGKPEDLFRYTSGRWLVDEKAQQQLRYVKFDLENRCRLAAAQFDDSTECVRVVKLEGNFNKAFLLTMNDGNEIISNIPCPNAGPPSLTTASEVATLKFRRQSGFQDVNPGSRTSIRVPEMFAWSSDATNPVGAEFSIMEKIIDQVTEIEKELGNISFPAYGSLFLRDSLPAKCRQYPLPPELDPEGLFCIARFPEFLTPPKNYILGHNVPSLPDGLDGLGSEQNEQAINDKKMALRSKYYEMSSLAHNKRIRNAMKLDSRPWEPFDYCQLFSQSSLVPLRQCLIRLSQDWSLLGLPGKCPFVISETELQRLDLCDLVKSQLLTDDSGWVPHDRWEATQEANRELYNLYIETMSEELTPQAAAKTWPFPPSQPA
ncbi:hypothetical protein PDE_05173 [Penicillium oxalicum 114-2]|uniref:Aminoglycoside phosphotransferase domain-containing protein n=1 Tax=Penicillium oxalicum (strain 114-2 / CGMCC 5302) TaxID=933388 RepID=S8AVE8_PENO1|nr:hypothetical protein PDE_05173 [Penicillium oxalicum 114-2]